MAELHLVPRNGYSHPYDRRIIHAHDLYHQHHAHPYALHRGTVSHYREPLPPMTIDVLRDEKFEFSSNLGWNMDYATAVVVDHIQKDGTANAERCRRAIQRAREHMHERAFRIYEAFKDLDIAIFEGCLANSVFLNYENNFEIQETIGATYVEKTRAKRIAIILSRPFMKRNKGTEPSLIVAALLHEMIHAYFLIACPPPSATAEGDPRLEHGYHFLKICAVLKSISACNAEKIERPLLLDFGGINMKEPMSEMYVMTQNGPRRIQIFDDLPFSDAHYEHFVANFRTKEHSVCPHRLKGTEQADLDKWYSGTCEPLLKAPKACQSAFTFTIEKGNKVEQKPRTDIIGDYVEFIYLEDKPIAVTRSVLDTFPSGKKFKRTVSINKNVPNDIFFSLHEFINSRSYKPDISSFFPMGNNGPPVIRARRMDDPAYVLLSVRMMKLGLAIKFTELAEVAKNRLFQQPETYEDALAVLDEIYDSSKAYSKLEKDKPYAAAPELRSFVKHWLQKSADWNGDGRCNIDYLKAYPDFADRCTAYPELAVDVKVVQEHLRHNAIHSGKALQRWNPAGAQPVVQAIQPALQYSNALVPAPAHVLPPQHYQPAVIPLGLPQNISYIHGHSSELQQPPFYPLTPQIAAGLHPWAAHNLTEPPDHDTYWIDGSLYSPWTAMHPHSHHLPF